MCMKTTQTEDRFFLLAEDKTIMGEGDSSKAAKKDALSEGFYPSDVMVGTVFVIRDESILEALDDDPDYIADRFWNFDAKDWKEPWLCGDAQAFEDELNGYPTIEVEAVEYAPRGWP